VGLRQVRPGPAPNHRSAEADSSSGGSADGGLSAATGSLRPHGTKDGAKPAGAGLWQRLRARCADRGDSEHEQILVRCAIAVLIVVGLAIAALIWSPPTIWNLLGIAGTYLVGSFVLLGHLLHDPSAHPARRYTGMLLDMVALTLVLLLGEDTSAIFYPFYLWITLGMGFRYGRSYLFVATALSLLSFILVVTSNAYWGDHIGLAAGLGLSLLVLPIYASFLLDKLTVAVARAEEANAAKSRFLATMSHELRTPLHAIIGMADILQGTRLTAEQKDMIGTVRSAGRTLLDMISDILNITKIEFGNAEGKTADFDLHGLIATVRALLQHQASGKGLELRVEIDPDVPYRLLGAALPLQQILVNLVANGIKFTHEGSITIRLCNEAITPDRAWIRIEVEDTGIGIPLEYQEHIFERFAQVDESATRRYGGTGLGLSIARNLAEMMGGTLTVASEPDAGACFTLKVSFLRRPAGALALQGRVVLVGPRLLTTPFADRMLVWGGDPVLAADPAQALDQLGQGQRHRVVVAIGASLADAAAQGADLAAHRAAEPFDLILVGAPDGTTAPPCLAVLPLDVQSGPLYNTLHAALAAPDASTDDALTVPWRSGATRQILVAEDNRTNQNVIQRMLHSVGHEVTIVEDGEQALEALEREPFDLVLMDLNMPVMGGLEAIKLHRFAAGGGPTPRFVALTADVSDETRRQCAAAGIDAYVTKPIEARELLSLVDRLTRRQQAPASSEIRASAVVVPHPRLTTSSPVLDPARLERLRQLDDDDGFVASVIRDFIEDADDLVREIAQAAAEHDAEAFRDRAHALRSSAAYLGATAIFDLCLSWRRISPEELAEHGASYAARLESAFEQLRAALHGILADHAGRARALSRPH